MGRLFALLLACLTLAVHASLLPRLGSVVPNDAGDPLLNTWILWWNAHNVPFTARYWHAPAFAPAPYVLALSETLLGLTWLTTPLQWLGASPLAAYNVMYIVTPVLNGLAAYWLCLTLTRRSDAAIVGGLACAFAPFQASQLPHLQTRAIFWMPLALVGLHRYWTTGRRRWLVLFAAALVGNGVTCGYFLLYFGVFLAMAIAWLAVSSWDRVRAAHVAGALGCSAAALAPVIVTYRSVKHLWALARPPFEIDSFGADLSTLATGSDALVFWPLHPREWQLPGGFFPQYPGLVIAALAAAVAVSELAKRPSAPAPPGRRIAVKALTIAAAVAFAAALGAWMSGGWALRLGPWSVTVSRLDHPIALGLYLLIAAALLSRRFVALARSGSSVALYAIGAMAATCLALGPTPRVLGYPFWYQSPFALLLSLPGFDSVRVPSLFAAITVVCLSVLAAHAVARFVRASTRASAVVVALLAAGIVIDGWTRVPIVDVPQPMPVAITGDLVVELPRFGVAEDVAAMYRGMTHGRPVVNGYSGYATPHYGYLVVDLASYCFESLDTVRGPRSLDVVIWRGGDEARRTDEALRAQWGESIREEANDAIVYHVPRAPDRGPARRVEASIDLRHACAESRRRRY